MHQIYSMETPINTARPPTVWDSHLRTDYVGLTHAHPIIWGACSTCYLNPQYSSNFVRMYSQLLARVFTTLSRGMRLCWSP